jgi:hypothetical protein
LNPILSDRPDQATWLIRDERPLWGLAAQSFRIREWTTTRSSGRALWIAGLGTYSEARSRSRANATVTTYTGTFSGDDLKLKETRQSRNGEQTIDIAAKRASS